MEMIFKAQKTQSQIDNPKWVTYLAVAFLVVFAVIYHENIHASTIVVGFIVCVILIIKQNNNFYLLINDKGISFHNGRSVLWTINKDNLKSMEHRPAHFYILYSKTALVSVLFNCNDNDSYSILTSYFSEEQAKEMQAAIEKIKN